MENKLDSYRLINESNMLTPNILLYPNLVKENIELIVKNCKPENLRPHIKTIKCGELVKMLQEAGVDKFKCATLKEAWLLGEVGAADVLLAYPLVGANVEAYLNLIATFPKTRYQGLVDDRTAANILNTKAMKAGVVLEVFIDINLGMNRTGLELDAVYDFGVQVSELSNLKVVGLHGYDGHIQNRELSIRYEKVKPIFDKLLLLYKELEEVLNLKLKLVLGGSNTFPIYQELPFVECSPGTFMLWDWGYTTTLEEQLYKCAAIIATRVVSKPTASTICLDLGHKAVAAENTIDKRIHFLEHDDWKAVSQSEEHLLVEVSSADWIKTNIGDMQYVIPYHICPTVAKYPYYQVIVNGEVEGKWTIVSRY